VYSAPTGSGKTFVVEYLLFKRLCQKGGKAILVLPFVSVARYAVEILLRMFCFMDEILMFIKHSDVMLLLVWVNFHNYSWIK